MDHIPKTITLDVEQHLQKYNGLEGILKLSAHFAHFSVMLDEIKTTMRSPYKLATIGLPADHITTVMEEYATELLTFIEVQRRFDAAEQSKKIKQ